MNEQIHLQRTGCDQIINKLIIKFYFNHMFYSVSYFKN